jgi:hypothetical protein
MRPEIRHIPSDEFSAYRWWEPQRAHRSPRWFYGDRHAGPRAAAHARESTVDRALRPLVAVCRAAGIATLPSCSGHFPPEATLRGLYRGLQRDRTWVRSFGLTLKCTESGTVRVYRNPDWKLPAYDTWAGPIRAQRGVGLIGLRFATGDPRAEPLARALSEIPGVCAYLTNAGPAVTLEIHTKANTPGQRDAQWQAIADRTILGLHKEAI